MIKKWNQFNESNTPPGPNVGSSAAIDLTDDDMDLFSEHDAVLNDLISKQKISVINNELWFFSNDKETIDKLEDYFPNINEPLGWDEENESLKNIFKSKKECYVEFEIPESSGWYKYRGYDFNENKIKEDINKKLLKYKHNPVNVSEIKITKITPIK